MKNPAFSLIQTIRDLLVDPSFLDRHRTAPTAFSRKRKLPFPSVVILVLQKTVKSIQLHLHEFFARLSDGLGKDAATASAWTPQRAKLSHTAFIELNQRSFADVARLFERAEAGVSMTVTLKSSYRCACGGTARHDAGAPSHPPTLDRQTGGARHFAAR